MFPLHCIPEILYAESINAELITVQKVFLYDPTLIHNTSVTDRQTGDRWQYGIIDAYSTAVIKKAC